LRKIFVAPLSSPDTTLHIDPIECYGCHEEYMLTVRENPYDDVKKYCATCFGHIFTLKDYDNVMRSLSPIHQILWEVPRSKLPEEKKDE